MRNILMLKVIHNYMQLRMITGREPIFFLFAKNILFCL